MPKSGVKKDPKQALKNLNISKNLLKMKKAFSLLELSVVILIIGILIIGISKGGEIVRKSRLASAASITKSSIIGKMDGLVLWYETTMPNSIDNIQAVDGTGNSDNTGNSTGRVGTWHDISDNKIIPYNAVQALNDLSPLYISDAINNLPALQFDGVNDLLLTTITSPINSTQLEVFTVCKRNVAVTNASSTTLYRNSSGSDTNINSLVFAHESTNGSLLQSFRGAGPLSTRTTHPGNNIPYIFSSKFDGANNTVYFNGTAQTSVASTGDFAIDRVLLGARIQGKASFYYQGLIGELIIFNRALSDQERNDVNQYLSKKWGIDLS